MEELGIDYNLVEIDKTNKPDYFVELYHRANPLPGARAKVPVLHMDDLVLCESTVISEFLSSMDLDGSAGEQQSRYWPRNPKKQATLRLFMELCGSRFSSYLDFTRVQDMKQVEEKHSIFQDRMREVDAFLSMYSIDEFTLADAHVAPFVQRSCGILPAPYDPISICQEFKLENLRRWIESLLKRESVIKTCPTEEIQSKREKLTKRLARIPQQVTEHATRDGPRQRKTIKS